MQSIKTYQCGKYYPQLPLKTVILPNSSNKLSPLDKDGQIITGDLDEAYALNDYFQDQTLIYDTDVEVPDVIQYNVAHRDIRFLHQLK